MRVGDQDEERAKKIARLRSHYEYWRECSENAGYKIPPLTYVVESDELQGDLSEFEKMWNHGTQNDLQELRRRLKMIDADAIKELLDGVFEF